MSALTATFTDPVRNLECVLVIPAGGQVRPQDGEPKIGVSHPGCFSVADLAMELDAFFCPHCEWNGRIYGVWAWKMIRASRAPNNTAALPHAQSR